MMTSPGSGHAEWKLDSFDSPPQPPTPQPANPAMPTSKSARKRAKKAAEKLASRVEQQQQPPPSTPSPKLEDEAAPVPHAPVLANIPAPDPQFRNIIIHLISRPGRLIDYPYSVILHKYRFRAPATSSLLALCDQIQQYFPADCAHLPIQIEAFQDEHGNKLPLRTATVEYLNPGEVLYAVCPPPLIGPADGLPPDRGQVSNTQPDQEMAEDQDQAMAEYEDQEMAENQETADNESMARPSLREAASKIKNAPPRPCTPAEQIVMTGKSTERVLWPSSPDEVPTPLSKSQPTRSAKRDSVRRKQNDDLEVLELPPQPDFKFQPGVLRKKGSTTAQTGPCVIIDSDKNTPAPAEPLPSVSARSTRSKKTLSEAPAPPRSAGGKKRDLKTNGKQQPQVVADDETEQEMDLARIKQEVFDHVHMADRDDELAQHSSPAPQIEQDGRQKMRDRALAAVESRKRSTAITPSKAAKAPKSSGGRRPLIRFPHEVTDLTRSVSPSPEDSGDEMEPEGPNAGKCTGKATSAVKKAAIDDPTPPSTRISRLRREAAKNEVPDSEPEREARIVGTPSTRMTRSAAQPPDMPLQSEKSASRTRAQTRPFTPSRNSAARATKVQASHNATAPRVVAGKGATAGRGHGQTGPMCPNKTEDGITEVQAPQKTTTPIRVAGNGATTRNGSARSLVDTPEWDGRITEVKAPQKTTTPTKAAAKGATARRGSVQSLINTYETEDEDTGGNMSGGDHSDRPVGHPKPAKLNRWADNRGSHRQGDQDDRAGASIPTDSPADGLAQQPSRTTKRKAEEDSNLPPQTETKRAKKEPSEQAQVAAERREYIKSLQRAWENDVSSGLNDTVTRINRSLQSLGVTSADDWVNYFCGRMVDQPAEASPARAFGIIWKSIIGDAGQEAEEQGEPVMTTTATAPGGDGGASDSEVSTVRLGREEEEADGKGERQDELSDVSTPEED